MATEQKLFGQFPPVPTAQWEEVITADLKGADYDKKLVWRTREGFNVRPYYRAEDLENLKYLGAGIGEFPYVRSTGKCNRWLVSQTVTTREEALKAIEGGAESVTFKGVKSRGCCLSVEWCRCRSYALCRRRDSKRGDRVGERSD